MNNDIFEIEEREETAPSTAASSNAGTYDDNAIQTLKWHIRRRPGMYIGKLGDGTHSDDGIYVLIKEVVDNSIDEFNMGAGKRIDITLTEEGEVTVRDYGRGIPLGKVKEVASDINTGGKCKRRKKGGSRIRTRRSHPPVRANPHRRTQRHPGQIHS